MNKFTKIHKYLPQIIIIGGIIIVGSILIFNSHASGPYSLTAADGGLITQPATKQVCAGSNDGNCVVFGSSSGSSGSGFVSVCGTSLCINGQTFTIKGATAYGTYATPSSEISLAQSLGVNTLELVEFDSQYHTLSDVESSATWNRVDQFISAASQAGLHVILNLSEYGQSLQAAGQTPTTTDWNSYLSFIANRVNTVSGVTYKNDPTIAKVEIFGEICYPNESDSGCPAGTTGTTAEMQSFFDRTENEWNALAPNILISSGGFSHLDSSNSNGIPWQNIIADPADSVCDIEVNSQNDVTQSIPKFTQACQADGKPWFLSAWSSCYADGSNYPFVTNSDSAMAAHAQDMYNIQDSITDTNNGGKPSTYAAVGSDFWNLKSDTLVGNPPAPPTGSCDIYDAFPLTESVIKNAR